VTARLNRRLRKVELVHTRGDPELFAHMLWRLRRTGSMAAAVEEYERDTGRRLRVHPDFLLRVERTKKEYDAEIRQMYAVTGGAVWADDPATRCPME
jgi:hypothetical protein